LLVPTPGQTEQLYLALNLNKKYGCLVQQQKDLNIPVALRDAKHFALNMPVNNKMLSALNDKILN
jgi:hypothetical protein